MSVSEDKKYDYDMSMEDILSSIRKYVSEEDEKKNDDVVKHDQDDDIFINLDESQITSHHEYNQSEQYQDKKEKQVNRSLEEQTSPPKSTTGTFNKLTEALKKAYGQSEQEKSSTTANNEVTMTQFLTAVSTKVIEKWSEENLKRIAEEIIRKEIEKIKSE